MILKLNDTPDSMVAFVACEEITKEDFDTVVLPAVHELVERTGKLNYLLVVADTIKKFTLDVSMKDAMVGFTTWNRAGIVTDAERTPWLIDLFNSIVPVEFKVFSHNQINQAVNWVGQGNEQ